MTFRDGYGSDRMNEALNSGSGVASEQPPGLVTPVSEPPQVANAYANLPEREFTFLVDCVFLVKRIRVSDAPTIQTAGPGEAFNMCYGRETYGEVDTSLTEGLDGRAHLVEHIE